VENLNTVIAANISSLRKEHKLTQLELAEKLNYSDKAVSKWERGESLPGIDVLCEMCTLFGVTLDYITGGIKDDSAEQSKDAGNGENALTVIADLSDSVSEPGDAKVKRKQADYRIVVPFLTVSGLWFIMISLFVSFSVFTHKTLWPLLYWSLPASASLLLVFTCIWGKKKYLFYLVSFIVWTIPLCTCLQFIEYDIWIVMSIVIPLQIAVLLCLSMSER